MKSTEIRRKRSRSKRTEGIPDSWLDAKRGVCENCDRLNQRWMECHHVVRKQHVEKAGGDIWDVRNAMTLCAGPFSCHSRHHARIHVIPSYKVPVAAIEFAVDLFGPGRAYEYLRREYMDVGVNRFDALLETT